MHGALTWLVAFSVAPQASAVHRMWFQKDKVPLLHQMTEKLVAAPDTACPAPLAGPGPCAWREPEPDPLSEVMCPACYCPSSSPSSCGALGAASAVKAAVYKSVITSEHKAHLAEEQVLQLVDAFKDTKNDDARSTNELKASGAIRRALAVTKSVATRARLCGKYDDYGNKVRHWLAEGKRASAFAVEAGNGFVAIAGVRELLEKDAGQRYAHKRSGAGKVAEIGMVYNDAECQGMGLSIWTMTAVIQRAKEEWGVDELLLEATEGAAGLYHHKFNFTQIAEPATPASSTPMSLCLTPCCLGSTCGPY